MGTTHSPYAGNEGLHLLSQGGLDHEPQDEQRRDVLIARLTSIYPLHLGGIGVSNSVGAIAIGASIAMAQLNAVAIQYEQQRRSFAAGGWGPW